MLVVVVYVDEHCFTYTSLLLYFRDWKHAVFCWFCRCTTHNVICHAKSLKCLYGMSI